MGVHQKIDRVARRHIRQFLPGGNNFPTTKEILHFEGRHGPDGIKRKSPGKDEPWHYIDPAKPHGELLEIIHAHQHNLADALGTGNRERAAFEAAWLAHAIVDGLTPAHHYPLEEKLSELRAGQGLETRNTVKEKLVLPGKTRRQRLKNNWEFWGAKGVMTTHLNFELGVATAISTMRFDSLGFAHDLPKTLEKQSFDSEYISVLKDISHLGMYEEFSQKGWTRRLARVTKNKLIPEIVRMVMLAWLAAVKEAEQRA